MAIAGMSCLTAFLKRPSMDAAPSKRENCVWQCKCENFNKPFLMRYFLLLMAIPVIGSSCSTMKSSSASASTSSHRPEKKSGSPEFIETIAIKPAKGGESYEAPPVNNKSKAVATTTGD